MRYIALLRGVNVGGNGLIRMSDLQTALTESGLVDVRTYIQSGNILFTSPENSDALVGIIEKRIHDEFHLEVGVIVLSEHEWHDIVTHAPPWWGTDKAWKHNLLVLLKPYDMDAVLRAFGELDPHLERIQSGIGVVYQSLSAQLRGKITSGKLTGSLSYRRMTVRNYNTALKLLTLLDQS